MISIVWLRRDGSEESVHDERRFSICNVECAEDGFEDGSLVWVHLLLLGKEESEFWDDSGESDAAKEKELV